MFLRSAFDHSSGRHNVWIQDHILVHQHTGHIPNKCQDLSISLIYFFFLFPFRDLGRQRSTIELDTQSVKPAQLQELEEAVNKKIRAHIPVNVKLLSIDDPAVEKVCIHLLCSLWLELLHILCWYLNSVFIHLSKIKYNYTQTTIVELNVCVSQVRSRGLPEDHAGPVRIIDIEGVDANVCCGTHVSNLSHLQVNINTQIQAHE